MSLIIIWVLASTYFYFQHLVSVKTDLILEKIVFADETIFITGLRMDDYQRKTSDIPHKIPWYYKTTKIPTQILFKFLEAKLFYSSPYTKYEDRGFLTVNGIRIGSNENRDEVKSMDDFLERYDISISDSVGQPFSMDSTSRATIADNQDILYFHYDEIPVPDDIDSIKLTITDNQNSLSKSILITAKWDEQVFSYFQRDLLRPKCEPEKTAWDFMSSIAAGDEELSEKYLHPDYMDSFDRSVLDHDLWNSPRWGYVLYEGNYQDCQDVFSFNLDFKNSPEEDAASIARQKLFLAFNNGNWQIIDITALDKLLIRMTQPDIPLCPNRFGRSPSLSTARR